MEAKRWPAPLSTLVVMLTVRVSYPTLDAVEAYAEFLVHRVVWLAVDSVRCGLACGMEGSQALLPFLPPSRKPHPSVYGFASRLQPSCHPPPPHTQQDKGGDHAVKDAGTGLPKSPARRPFSPPACMEEEGGNHGCIIITPTQFTHACHPSPSPTTQHRHHVFQAWTRWYHGRQVPYDPRSARRGCHQLRW